MHTTRQIVCCTVATAVFMACHPQGRPPPQAQKATPAPGIVDGGLRTTLVEHGDGWDHLRLEGSVDRAPPARWDIHRISGAKGWDNAPLPEEIKIALAGDKYLAANPNQSSFLHDAAMDTFRKQILDRVLDCDLTARGRLECRSRIVEAAQEIDQACADIDDEKLLHHDLQKSFNKSFHFPPPPLDAIGDIYLAGDTVFSVVGRINLLVPYHVKMIGGPSGSCVPLIVTFKPFTISGQPNLSADLTGASFNFTKSKTFQQLIAHESLFNFVFAIYGFPVNIELALAEKVGVTVGIDGKAKLSLEGGATLPIKFSYTCGPDVKGPNDSRCNGDASLEKPIFRPINVSGAQVSGAGWVQPWVGAYLRIGLYTSHLDNIYIGLAPFFKGSVWGAVPGLNICDVDGDGAIDAATGVLFDGDAGVMVQAGISSDLLDYLEIILPAEVLPGDRPLTFSLKKLPVHLAFRDLLPVAGLGTSMVLTPMLQVSSNPRAGAETRIGLKMNDCYPYDDEMSYSVSWGDGTTSAVQFSPHVRAELTHTYSGQGTPTISLLAEKDDHAVTGRLINRTTAKQIVVGAAEGN